jgi:hypothetical protein
MNFRVTYALFGLFALAIIGFGIVISRKAGADARALLSSAKSAKVKADDITAVEIEPADGAAIGFERSAGTRTWKMVRPQESRADSQAVDAIVNDVLNLQKENRPGSADRNLAGRGLDKPSLKVTLKKGEQAVGTLNLGGLKLSEGGGAVYVNSSDHPREAYTVQRYLLESLFRRDATAAASASSAGDLARGPADFRSKDLLAAGVINPADSLQTVRVTLGKSEPVVLNRGSDSIWRFEKPAGFGEADLEGEGSGFAPEGAAPTGVKPLLQSLSGLRVGASDDFVDDVSDLKKYGLDADNADKLRIEIVRKPTAAADGDEKKPITEVLEVGGKADEKGEKVYARLQGDPGVVKVSAKAVDPFRQFQRKPSALRDRSLVTTAQQAEIDAIDIRAGGEPVLLRKAGEPAAWKLYDTAGQDVAAGNRFVADLLNALTQKRLVTDFPTGTDAELGFDKPTVEVSLWTQGVVPPEKKTEAKKDEPKKDEAKKDAKPAAAKGPPKLKSETPTVKLVFGRKDKDVVYVRREAGGTKTTLAVPTRTLDAVTKARTDFIDLVLPSFVADAATKLTFNRGAEAYELEKDEKANAWTFKQPKDLAGRRADPDKVRVILGDLARLSAAKLIAEKGKPDELERWGLQPAAIKATVTLKEGESKERAYLFGKETPEGGTVYAKQGERDLVFTVGKPSLNGLTTGELIDPSVLRLDLTKVTGLKLAGWQNLTGTEAKLTLERKGKDGWSVKAQEGVKIDPLDAAKAEGFLTGLVGLRAESFVSHKGEVKPEYKLDAKDGALAVEVTQEGEKEPFTVTVGGEDASGRFLYATSKQMPKDVFLVPKDRFEKAKGAPTYFKK